ncbi:MAG: recombination-associated protein RdgC [Syntrophobacteraceae bacterium]
MNIGSSFTRAYIADPGQPAEWVRDRLEAGVFRGIEDGLDSAVGFLPFDNPDCRAFQATDHIKGEYCAFRFVKHKKRVPGSVLRMRVDEQVENFKAASGRKPSRAELARMRENMEAVLLAQAFSMPAGCVIIWHLASGRMLIGSTGAGMVDDFLQYFEKVFQLYPQFQFHSRWALRVLIDRKLKDRLKSQFSWNDPFAVSDARPLGYEFLTWLWYSLERQGSTVKLPDGKEAVVSIGDKLTLVAPMDRAERCLCVSRDNGLYEAREALRRGKVLDEARLWIEGDGNEYGLQLDSTLQSWKSLAIPKTPAGDGSRLDQDGLFLSQVGHVETISGILDTLYGRFLAERLSPTWERSIVALMHEWFARTEEEAA